ncbi:PIN domain-containing protein [Candidatus Woesearchaeota archaeon]|nr:PIN domain-containing protein [Candidatus Woesearchaeota archaeon]
MSLGEPFTVSIRYFFDTYALIEIRKGNNAYSKYLDEAFFITLLNLFEFHQYLLRVGDENDADLEVKALSLQTIEFGIETVKKASKFRSKHRNKGLSMTDCIGYVHAMENDLLFLTGDKEFKGLPNVEFVK